MLSYLESGALQTMESPQRQWQVGKWSGLGALICHLLVDITWVLPQEGRGMAADLCWFKPV